MKKYTADMLDCEDGSRLEEGGAVYLASEVDAVLKHQASAALAGMNAAKAISSGQLLEAHRLRAESAPEMLESEREANSMLTALIEQHTADYDHEKMMRLQCEARVAELDAALTEAVGLFNAQKQMYDASHARVAGLETALGNCRLLAMKRLHRGAVEKADWEAILRFCIEAGCGPSPLRADS